MTTKPDMAHADGCLAVELVAARHMAGAARVAAEEAVAEAEAATWVVEMLKLLRVCAHARREGYDFLLRPSRKVDLAWHAFILHTRDYADNCRSELDFFVHHAPEAPPNGNGADVQGMFDYAPVP